MVEKVKEKQRDRDRVSHQSKHGPLHRRPAAIAANGATAEMNGRLKSQPLARNYPRKPVAHGNSPSRTVAKRPRRGQGGGGGGLRNGRPGRVSDRDGRVFPGGRRTEPETVRGPRQ
ncbi:hypothetical protein GWI33_007696 [Rhynchophorus ferrugineus]|uniref:Uncharacterized protein n=1 Tax=Rhynchophorus ferrugineus TaxID=354439 RepID=A0A834IIE3_RHYFE|nr:hypothetical protein GWI33_007696 [Rhynchophorus ferrugineus]